MIIKSLSFPLYGTIILVGILVGMYYIYFHIKKEVMDNKLIIWFFLLYGMFAVVGGKSYTSLVYWKTSFIESGLSAYGGLIGVVIASLVIENIIPMEGKCIKYTILSLPLVYGITKVGCFIAGCCYGIPYDGIFSVIYENGLNIKVFPIQMVESIISIIIFIVCSRFKNNKYISYIVLLCSIITKFLLDFLRYEHINMVISRNQIVSIILFFVVIGIFIYKEVIKKSN